MAYAPAHRWRVLTDATWGARQGLARNEPPSVRPSTTNDALVMGPGSPLPPPPLGHGGQEMSLPYTVAPGAGAGDALTGGATETEDAEAERIRPRVAAMVVSRPGRMVCASSTRGTRQVCFMMVTTPNGSRATVAPNDCQAPGTGACSRPRQAGRRTRAGQQPLTSARHVELVVSL